MKNMNLRGDRIKIKNGDRKKTYPEKEKEKKTYAERERKKKNLPGDRIKKE